MFERDLYSDAVFDRNGGDLLVKCQRNLTDESEHPNSAQWLPIE